MVSVEKTAKTVDEAIEAALSELNVTRDDVEIYTIEEGSKGFLGIGGKDAKVIVTLKDSPALRAKSFLDGLFSVMGEEVKVDVDETETDVNVEFSGPDMGMVIGKRGETLDAIQHLTSLVVNNGDNSFVKVSVDTENYREKRNAVLESLAKKLAKKVAKSGRNTTLEPMNAYERSIHATLQDDPYVTTYSIGQGINRKVVIALKK